MGVIARSGARQTLVAVLGLTFLVCALWELGSFAFHSAAYDSVWAQVSGQPTTTFVWRGLLHSRYYQMTVDYEFKVGGKRYTGHATSDYGPRDGGIWVYYWRSNPAYNTPESPSDPLLRGVMWLLGVGAAWALHRHPSWGLPSNNRWRVP